MAVALYHYTVVSGIKIESLQAQTTAGLTYGYYGVQLFFIVSGFVILLTLARTKHPLDFVVSRLTRIFPLYWVAVILTFFILTFSNLPLERPDIGLLCANFLLFQPLLGFDYLDGVYWSLLIEMYFYFWMLMIFLSRQLHRIIWFCWAWMGLIWVAHFMQLAGMQFSWFITEFLLLNHAHQFVAGIIFYRALHNGWIKGDLLLLFLCWISEYPLGGWQGLLIVASFFSAFILFVNGKLGWIERKPLVFLGSISYALYLIHQYLGYAVMELLSRYGLPHLLLWLAAVMVSIGVAALLTYFIEQPVLRWLRQVYNRWKGSRASSALSSSQAIDTASD